MATPVLTRDTAWRRLTTTGFVLLVVTAVVLVRLSYLDAPLKSDEGGYLVVARAWHLGGPHLYGHYWVDRPPLLFAIYKVATLLPWHLAIRLLAIGFVLLFVLAATWAGRQVGGSRGARWAAAVGGALMISPALWTQFADGELLAAPLVMTSIALTLSAVRHTGWSCLGLAALAGFVGASAVMVKQNFVDALVFAVVLVLVSMVQRALSAARGLLVLAGGLLGVLVVLLVAGWYAVASGAGVRALWFAMYGFRVSAFDLIVDQGLHAPRERAVALAALALVSGIVPMLVVLAGRAARHRASGPPVAWALGLAAAAGILSVMAGGNYWPHYLIQLAPVTALAAGLWAGRSGSVRWVSRFVVGSALVSLAVLTLSGAKDVGRVDGVRIGDWIADSSHHGDTATVMFGHAEVQQATGLPSPYPYMWGLPVRTLDPHHERMVHLLAGPRAPTWVVVWQSPTPRHLGPHGVVFHPHRHGGLQRLRYRVLHPGRHGALHRELRLHYRLLRRFCGRNVWLHDGVRRHLAPTPHC
jgi:hypothetical protein